MADFATAKVCLHENLAALDGNKMPETSALWNVSNALLVICDSLAEIEQRLANLERQRS